MAQQPAASVLAFDVYGTLINPFHMEEHLRAIFGDRAREATDLWRSKQIEYSFRRALMKKYENFDACTARALQFVSRQLGVPISDDAGQKLLQKYLQLPAYADVSGALAELASRGFRIAACSNGTENSVRLLLEGAGIRSHFREIVSGDALRTYKPDPAVYENLAMRMNSAKENIWLISSNPFDVIGAKACGLSTIWVQRDSAKAFDPWEFEADLIVHGLEELSAKLKVA